MRLMGLCRPPAAQRQRTRDNVLHKEWDAIGSLHRRIDSLKRQIFNSIFQYNRSTWIILLLGLFWVGCLMDWLVRGVFGWAQSACETLFLHGYPQHIHFSVPRAFLAGFYRLDLIFIITLKRPSAILITHYQLLSLIALTVSLSAIW